MARLNTAQQNYLVRAAEADLEAARVKDPVAKESWLKIAKGYRELATSKAAGERLSPD